MRGAEGAGEGSGSARLAPCPLGARAMPRFPNHWGAVNLDFRCNAWAMEGDTDSNCLTMWDLRTIYLSASIDFVAGESYC